MDRISLFIPTKNRPEFLLRLLEYYRDTGFQGPIIIGDSSDPKPLEQTKSDIEGLRRNLDLHHEQLPELNGVQCVARLVQLVSTPYTAFSSDDDFLIPSALGQCAIFLSDNPDYSAAHGLGTLVSVQGNGSHGKVKGAGYFRQPTIEGENALQRVTDLFQNYAVTVFSLHRTQAWRQMYKNASQITDWRWFGGEFLQCSRSAIAGKIKQLDCLYIVRQVHDHMESSAAPGQQSAINLSATSHTDVFDWVSGPDWAKSYETFIRLISEEMAKEDQMEIKEAQQLVKQVFWKYLSETLDSKWHSQFSRNGRGSEPLSRKAARALPGAPWLFNQWKSFRGNLEKRLNVEAMLRPSSAYHANFMPIYRAITAPAATPES